MRKTDAFLLLLICAAPAFAGADGQGSLWDGRKGTFEPGILAVPAVQGVPASPGSDWSTADPDDANRETNPSAPDKNRFWENLQNQVLDVCRHVDIVVDQEFALGQFAKVGGRAGRSMMRYPNGNLALLDEFTPRLGVSYPATLFDSPEGIHGGISFGASMQDSSLVVRPLADKRSCKELLRMANPISVKTVLPIRAKRFTEMEVGELWKMGMTFSVGFSPSVGASYSGVSVTLSWGKSHANSENISLFRVSKEQLRLRFRLDRADITSLGGALGGSVTVGELGLQVSEDLLARQLGTTAAGFIDKQINHVIAHTLNNYLRAVLEVSDTTRHGRQAVLEFLLDPGDPAQMDALAGLLKGNIFSLKHLAHMVKPIDLPEVVDERGRLETWVGGAAGPLDKKESFAGSDSYDRKTKNLHLKLPVLWDHQSSWAKNTEDIVLLDSKGSRINVYQSEKRRSNKFLDIPLVGAWTNHDKWRNAQTFTSKDKDGATLSPAVMYVQQEGFRHESAATAKSIAVAADDIMRFVGTHGNGVNARTSLPVDTLFPEAAVKDNPGYRASVAALTMLFNQKAVQDILKASAEEVAKSFLNAQEQGRLEVESADGQKPTAASLSSVAEKIVRDLAEAKNAPTPEKQAEAFSKILSGSGHSGLAYEDILKVFVQLIDPLDLSAEFYMRTDKHVKGEKDVNVRYILNDRKISDDKLLGQMLEARKRFIEPTKITD